MENRNSVDQRRQAVWQFIDAHRALLARQGSLLATWRRRAGQRTGPCFLLVVREAQDRSRSVYLGAAGPLVDEVRAELGRLQTPQRERRVFRRVNRQLRRALQRAKQELDQHLAPVGLRLQGCEVRGWRAHPARSILSSPSPAASETSDTSVITYQASALESNVAPDQSQL